MGYIGDRGPIGSQGEPGKDGECDQELLSQIYGNIAEMKEEVICFVQITVIYHSIYDVIYTLDERMVKHMD